MSRRLTSGAALMLLALTSAAAAAPFNFIVPQAPGGGTSIWATEVAAELKPFLGEEIIITHIPGSQDQIGFEKFVREMRDDPMAIMISHGGNAVSYLEEDVAYSYADLSPVAQMSSNIIVSRRADAPVSGTTIFSEQSGSVPEALALAMLVGWDNVRYVKGMNAGDARLAFRRGELNTIRENPLAHAQHIDEMINSGEASIWFHHGLFDGTSFVADPNFADVPTFSALYQDTKEQDPSAESLFAAYRLVTAWRDGLQKAVWVHPDNPNRDRLVAAFKAMLEDPAARARLDDKLGAYPWRLGDEGAAFLARLCGLITEDALRDLVAFNHDALGLQSVYRPALLTDCVR